MSLFFFALIMTCISEVFQKPSGTYFYITVKLFLSTTYCKNPLHIMSKHTIKILFFSTWNIEAVHHNHSKCEQSLHKLKIKFYKLWADSCSPIRMHATCKTLTNVFIVVWIFVLKSRCICLCFAIVLILQINYGPHLLCLLWWMLFPQLGKLFLKVTNNKKKTKTNTQLQS